MDTGLHKIRILLSQESQIELSRSETIGQSQKRVLGLTLRRVLPDLAQQSLKRLKPKPEPVISIIRPWKFLPGQLRQLRF